jgi:hypothetical protein
MKQLFNLIAPKKKQQETIEKTGPKIRSTVMPSEKLDFNQISNHIHNTALRIYQFNNNVLRAD